MSLLINIGLLPKILSKYRRFEQFFRGFFPEKQIICQGYSIASGVQEQPCSDEETKARRAQSIGCDEKQSSKLRLLGRD